MSSIDLSIVVVTYNTKNITYECIRSIYNSKTKYNFEVILVDNNSADETSNFILKHFSQIKLIKLNENVGFSKANNIGIKCATGNYILLLNSDTLLFHDSIDNLLSTTIQNSFDISSPILLNKDHTIQKSCFNFPKPIKTFLRITDLYHIIFKILSLIKNFQFEQKPKSITPQYVSFACVLIKKEVLTKIGLLDENLFFYHEDCEFGLRAKKFNIKIHYCTNAKIIHLGGTSSNEFSLIAFENDIKGLLYVYKIHYNSYNFNLEKISILFALTIRMIFWHFGLYRRVKKISIYNDKKPSNGNNKLEIFKIYKKVFNYTLLFKYK